MKPFCLSSPDPSNRDFPSHKGFCFGFFWLNRSTKFTTSLSAPPGCCLLTRRRNRKRSLPSTEWKTSPNCEQDDFLLLFRRSQPQQNRSSFSSCCCASCLLPPPPSGFVVHKSYSKPAATNRFFLLFVLAPRKHTYRPRRGRFIVLFVSCFRTKTTNNSRR